MKIAAQFAIVILSGLAILGELGVNILPLLAGAGVVGLAIGFGAQTLVKDIISGVFFLIDDAFRKGEYIDIGSVKGTVEKISLRSMQLRHHNGPLHTIPFGDIRHVTNFSRDWVIMKLSLRLTYDTDAEKVRKLIKKLGQEMAEEPNLKPLFLQPLKSQGVIEMQDSAQIMRVKFMTRPGDQWGLRRVVFARIRDLFEKEGIRFASREVAVRIADHQGEREDRDRHRVHQVHDRRSCHHADRQHVVRGPAHQVARPPAVVEFGRQAQKVGEQVVAQVRLHAPADAVHELAHPVARQACQKCRAHDEQGVPGEHAAAHLDRERVHGLPDQPRTEAGEKISHHDEGEPRDEALAVRSEVGQERPKRLHSRASPLFRTTLDPVGRRFA